MPNNKLQTHGVLLLEHLSFALRLASLSLATEIGVVDTLWDIDVADIHTGLGGNDVGLVNTAEGAAIGTVWA